MLALKFNAVYADRQKITQTITNHFHFHMLNLFLSSGISFTENTTKIYTVDVQIFGCTNFCRLIFHGRGKETGRETEKKGGREGGERGRERWREKENIRIAEEMTGQ